MGFDNFPVRYEAPEAILPGICVYVSSGIATTAATHGGFRQGVYCKAH